jgi:hypothetical protein
MDLSRIDTSGGPTACHPWCGPLTTGGYGRVKHEGSSQEAHRVLYTLTRGPLPRGHVVRHMCLDRSTKRIDGTARGDRRCCNLAHLDAGTQSANALDRERARRIEARRARSQSPRRHW